jgi:hypothetical protein
MSVLSFMDVSPPYVLIRSGRGIRLNGAGLALNRAARER